MRIYPQTKERWNSFNYIVILLSEVMMWSALVDNEKVDRKNLLLFSQQSLKERENVSGRHRYFSHEGNLFCCETEIVHQASL